MEFKLVQTVTDGECIYASSGADAPLYTAAVSLAFGGITLRIEKAAQECRTLLFTKKLPFSQRFKYLLPRDMYGVSIYAAQTRTGSVKFQRRAWLGRLTFLLLLDKRVFSAYEFTSWSDGCEIYVYEDGVMRGRIRRERQTYDDKTVYDIWVNDTRPASDTATLPDAAQSSETLSEPLPPRTTDADTAFISDALAVFTVYYDIVRKKPFGEYTYAYNHSSGHGIRNPFFYKKIKKEYAAIIAPPPPPAPEPVQSDNPTEPAELAVSDAPKTTDADSANAAEPVDAEKTVKKEAQSEKGGLKTLLASFARKKTPTVADEAASNTDTAPADEKTDTAKNVKPIKPQNAKHKGPASEKGGADKPDMPAGAEKPSPAEPNQAEEEFVAVVDEQAFEAAKNDGIDN